MTGSTVKRGKRARPKTRKPQTKRDRQDHQHMIPGFHAVLETLEKEDDAFQEIWIAEGKQSTRTQKILNLAKAKNIPIYLKQQAYLSELFYNIAHQGIVGITKTFSYADLHAVLQHALDAGPSALLLAADHMTDSGNLGALMRTGAFFGSHGLIIPKDRSAQITPAAMKRSSGAHVKLPVARVTNLGRALDEASKNGLWIIGAAGEARKTIYEFDWKRPLLLVFGSEQKGIGVSVRKKCHELVAIPSPGGFESLNISVAGGVILSEIYRQRSIT